ncbi:MAG: single-stranded-DNA-specific exonuclease RecJ [Blastocatellia bacterium]|nr:single-stranded-DNA-specific exonuclease RecJ [Blastocatellia bacterium]
MLQKRWNIQTHDRAAAHALAAALGLKPLTAALLIARGHDTTEAAHRFLNPSFDHLHDPSLLKGIDVAADRIFKAIDGGEKILIWGDYDVDGTTGTVLLRQALKILGAVTEYHIPNRFSEGYGLNIPALKAAMEGGCSLVITVDCGIRSFEEVGWARENGLDIIITDHHLSDSVKGTPAAYAVVNPNQDGCTYPDKNLAGVGVAFKIACVLLKARGREDLIRSFLKMTAIGTIADIMQLTGENRAIVALGLRDLQHTNNFGLKALMEVADCRSDMKSYHIGFRIGPRINAAGRMDAGKQVVELFDAPDFNEARRIAELLDGKNKERQKVQQRITEEALLRSVELGKRKFVVVAGEGWHRGVIGLAASRIAERLNRPTVVLSVENGTAHGSARSIPGFHLLDAMGTCPELFHQFGGHAAAAGMTMDSTKVSELLARLDQHARNVLCDDELVPQLNIDANVSSETMDLDLLADLDKLEPFGAGNPKPVFATKGLFLRFDPTVIKEKHLKLYLADAKGRRFQAIWWDGMERSSGRTLHEGNGIELAYTPEFNHWQGNTQLQLVVHDVRPDN